MINLGEFQESYLNYLKNKQIKKKEKFDTRINYLINIGKNHLELGEISKGFKSYDKGIKLYINKFKLDNSNTKKLIDEYILILNKLFIYNINLRKVDKCIILLKKCENLFINHHYKNKKYISLTYNNFSLLYKKIGNLKMALKYSKKSKLCLLKSNNVIDNLLLAINNCSILSGLNE